MFIADSRNLLLKWFYFLCVMISLDGNCSHGRDDNIKTKNINNLYVPQTLDEFEERLRQLIPQLIVTKTYKGGAKVSYLRLATSRQPNQAFLALKKVFQKNVLCDTETILVAFYVKQKLLPLEEIFMFLLARKETDPDESLSEDDQYEYYMWKLLSLCGEPQINNLNLELTEILNINQYAIVRVEKHIGIIFRAKKNLFLTSECYTDADIYFTCRKMKKSKTLGDLWGKDMWVHSFVLLNDLAKPLPIIQGSQAHLFCIRRKIIH